MSRATERCEMVKPSLRSSPWIRGAPQSGLACAIFWIRPLSSEPIGGRPGPRGLDFQVQKARNPWRCQRITVSGRTKCRTSRQRDQRRERWTQKSWSNLPNRGRLDRWRRRASCCRSARFSSTRLLRARRAERSEPSMATTMDHMDGQPGPPRRLPSSHKIQFWPTTTSARILQRGRALNCLFWFHHEHQTWRRIQDTGLAVAAPFAQQQAPASLNHWLCSRLLSPKSAQASVDPQRVHQLTRRRRPSLRKRLADSSAASASYVRATLILVRPFGGLYATRASETVKPCIQIRFAS